MSLMQKVEQDLILAMKAKDATKLSVLRMVKAAFGNYQIEKKKNSLEDPEAVEILQRQAKQRRESYESFEKGGRKDLAQKEQLELRILEEYLPKQLNDEELKAIAQQVITQTGAKSKADIGKVMKDLMPQVKGKADGKRVNEVLSRLLP